MGIMFDFSLRPIWLKWKVLYYWRSLRPLPCGSVAEEERFARRGLREREYRGRSLSISSQTDPLLKSSEVETPSEGNIGIKLRGSIPLWLS